MPLDRRLALALGLAVLALAVSSWFVYGTHQCGMMRQTPGSPPECVSYIHPIAIPLGIASAAAVAGVATRNRAATATLAVLALIAGGFFVFSAGFTGLAVGVLLLAAAWATPPSAEARRRRA